MFFVPKSFYVCLQSCQHKGFSFDLIYALARVCQTLSRVKKVDEQAWITPFRSHLEDLYAGFQTKCLTQKSLSRESLNKKKKKKKKDVHISF